MTQHQSLEIYKVLEIAKHFVMLIERTEKLCESKGITVFNELKNIAKSQYEKLKPLRKDFKKICSNDLTNEDENKLAELYDSGTEVLGKLSAVQEGLVATILDYLTDEFNEVSHISIFILTLKLNDLNDRDNFFQQLALLGQNPYHIDRDKQTIDKIIIEYLQAQNQKLESLLDLSTLTSPIIAVGILEEAHDLLNSIKNKSNNVEYWCSRHPDLIELLKDFSTTLKTYSNQTEIVKAFDGFLANKESPILENILTYHPLFTLILNAQLHALKPAIVSWKNEKKYWINYSLAARKFRLESVKMELAIGLGKVHGVKDIFPKIPEFKSSDPKTINAAFDEALKQMEQRLDKITALIPSIKKNFLLSKEWIYLTLLKEYLYIDQELYHGKKNVTNNEIYIKFNPRLNTLEEKYFEIWKKEEALRLLYEKQEKEAFDTALYNKEIEKNTEVLSCQLRA